MKVSLCSAFVLVFALIGTTFLAKAADPVNLDPPISKWVPSTAYLIPEETAPDGEGYFSIIEGHNGRIYIGTHANGINSWLVEFNPETKKMEPVVDVHKVIGKDLKGFGSQAKIHTRNNTGKLTGKIYFGSKQGYPEAGEKRTDYPGGYPMAYDPKTGETEVWPIPVKHQGINSIMPDESRGLVYISTCSDDRPVENAVFLVLDLKTGKYKELIDTKHMYGFICLDDKGRAYHPVQGGKIARYDPETQKLDLLNQTIDGKAPTPESHLADPEPQPINWDASPDGKTLYVVPMLTNQLYAYDLTATGDTIPGKSLGTLVPEVEKTDCRALCVGPQGQVWAAVAATHKQPSAMLLHLVSYKPDNNELKDHGVVDVTNRDFVAWNDAEGKPINTHRGFLDVNGHFTTKSMVLGVCESATGDVYVLALLPYTLLQVKADQLK